MLYAPGAGNGRDPPAREMIHCARGVTLDEKHEKHTVRITVNTGASAGTTVNYLDIVISGVNSFSVGCF